MASEQKKRKRSHDNDDSTHRSKKHAAAHKNGSIHLSVAHLSKSELMPILAVPVGLSMPHYAMKTYQKNVKNDETPYSRRPLLLHSSEHRRLDYIANEEFGNCADKLLKHYVGIYDPEHGEMELVAVKKMAVRTVLRPSQEEIDEAAHNRDYQTILAQRQALGMEFGTKKSKKAIQSLAENAIIAAGKPSAATKALMSAIGDNVVNMPTAEDMRAAAEADKPRPIANISATRPEDVYPISLLVDSDSMDSIDIADWLQAGAERTAVSTTSKYVSRRLQSILGNEDVLKLKVLKYILMSIEFYQRLRPTKGGSMIPPRSELEKLGHPLHLMDNIRKRFAKERLMTVWELDNLMTHIMAMALFIDDYNVDMEDLKDDFRLEYARATELFRSLACKVTAPTDREKSHMQLTAAEMKYRKVARLVLPLEFPKPRSMGRKRNAR